MFPLVLSAAIVPFPKPKDTRSKAVSCNDFRAVAISPVLSNVFEYCILEKFQSVFVTEDNQFGFKKNLSCRHAIYRVRNVVDRYVNGGNTVHLRAIDLTNAFDKVNHHALYIKLMKRNIPVQLLEVLSVRKLNFMLS